MTPPFSRGGHRHLQMRRMLDIDLIPDLRSKGVKGRTFSKNRNQRSCLLPWSLHMSKIELFYLRISIFGRGGGVERIKPHLEVIICILNQDRHTETLKYHSETGANSQTDTRWQPPPLTERSCLLPLPRPFQRLKVVSIDLSTIPFFKR